LRTEAPQVAQLRDLVPGLDSIGSFAIPFARLPRRLGAWADVASQTPQALLIRPADRSGVVPGVFGQNGKATTARGPAR
jgi:hypothetical protein